MLLECCKYIEDITRRREAMNFMFEWQEQYLTSERSEREYPLFIMWLCLARTGNYRIHEFDWLKSRPEVFCGEKVAN